MRWIIGLLAALALLAGCGGGSDSLSAGDEATVASFRANASLVAGGSDRWYGNLLTTTDAVIVIARDSPDAVYTDGDGNELTMRQVLSDAATTLEGAEPDLAERLGRTVATLD